MRAPVCYQSSMTTDRIVVVGAGIIRRIHRIPSGEARRESRDRGCHSSRRGSDRKILRLDQRDILKTSAGYFDLNQLGIAGWRRLETELGGELKVQWGGSVAVGCRGRGSRWVAGERPEASGVGLCHAPDRWGRVPTSCCRMSRRANSARRVIANSKARWIRWTQ